MGDTLVDNLKFDTPEQEQEYHRLMENTTYGQLRKLKTELGRLLLPIKNIMIIILDEITELLKRAGVGR